MCIQKDIRVHDQNLWLHRQGQCQDEQRHQMTTYMYNAQFMITQALWHLCQRTQTLTKYHTTKQT